MCLIDASDYTKLIIDNRGVTKSILAILAGDKSAIREAVMRLDSTQPEILMTGTKDASDKVRLAAVSNYNANAKVLLNGICDKNGKNTFSIGATPISHTGIIVDCNT